MSMLMYLNWILWIGFSRLIYVVRILPWSKSFVRKLKKVRLTLWLASVRLILIVLFSYVLRLWRKELAMANRRIVFSEEQLDILLSDPVLASAIVYSLKNEPGITVDMAIKMGRASVRQMQLFDEALASGNLLPPDKLENVKHNDEVIRSIRSQAADELQAGNFGEPPLKRRRGTNVS